MDGVDNEEEPPKMAAVSVILFTVCILSSFFLYCTTLSSSSLPNFPAILIFGDSVMDTGNNNHINTWVKANYAPYGQDFPGRLPTGRFSNGKLIPDMLASVLGIKDYVPPFLDPTLSETDLVTGVNFASAGSGFDDLTTTFSNVISFSNQVHLFKDYIQRLKGIVGEVKALEIINGALVIVSSGTNDWLFNYYDIPTRRLEFNVSGYQDFQLNKISHFTKELYDLGCRFMIVSGLAPTGCLPVQKTLSLWNSQRHCLEDENADSETYNQKLVNLLPQIQATLPGTKIIYNDLYQTVMDMISNPQKYGFEETDKGCCGSGAFKVSVFCDKASPTCKNASKFLFWDMIHPTQTAYHFIVSHMVRNIIPHFS